MMLIVDFLNFINKYASTFNPAALYRRGESIIPINSKSESDSWVRDLKHLIQFCSLCATLCARSVGGVCCCCHLLLLISSASWRRTSEPRRVRGAEGSRGPLHLRGACQSGCSAPTAAESTLGSKSALKEKKGKTEIPVHVSPARPRVVPRADPGRLANRVGPAALRSSHSCRAARPTSKSATGLQKAAGRMMSYIKQPHYTMNGLNLPGPGMDVLHTTVAYPREYDLEVLCFKNI